MFRGNIPAKIDEKGRLKVPTQFREELDGGRCFVTSVEGDCVRLYPFKEWLRIEKKLASVPSTHFSVQKFIDRVNYYGQTSELDSQGRVVIPPHLRESASIVGDVRVFGRIEYLEVWNDQRFLQKLQREAWTDEDGLRLSEHGI